jgi:hypothetical protein
MTSAFDNYGTEAQVLTYLKSTLENQYQTMIDHMTPEWRKAVVYVLGRSKSRMYLDSMYQAYEGNILDRISPSSVLAGTDHFSMEVDQLCAITDNEYSEMVNASQR